MLSIVFCLRKVEDVLVDFSGWDYENADCHLKGDPCKEMVIKDVIQSYKQKIRSVLLHFCSQLDLQSSRGRDEVRGAVDFLFYKPHSLM